MSIAVIQEPPQLRLVTMTTSGTEAADLTDQADGPGYSNVNPGGDERCTFELKREWFTGASEIGQGKVLQVRDGLDVLWHGLIDENDRRVANSENIGVTGYGMGIRLKDKENFRILGVDRDLNRWQVISRARRIALLTGASPYTIFDPAVAPDVTSGVPSVNQTLVGSWTIRAIAEALYDAGPGLAISAIYYDWEKSQTIDNADANWSWIVRVVSTDTSAAADATGELRAASSSPTYLTSANGYRFGQLLAQYGAAKSSDGTNYTLAWKNLAVYGTHGLTRRGSGPGGLYDNDLVTYIAGQAAGITARRVDATNFIVAHYVQRDGVTHEQAIIDASRFSSVDWGTWGPDSVLDTSLNGQFDWKQKDLTTQHWFALRSECDDIGLNVELNTLYDSVEVSYNDGAGSGGVETRTLNVPVLSGRPRVKRLDGGTLTQTGAQQLGDTFLALQGQEPPARGSVTVSQPIQHYRLGRRWPHRMRADGANLRLPDVLPSKDALSLSTAPDRRTTFPVKRVSVDASGQVPKTTVEVDQSRDTLALVQARLQQAAGLALGF